MQILSSCNNASYSRLYKIITVTEARKRTVGTQRTQEWAASGELYTESLLPVGPRKKFACHSVRCEVKSQELIAPSH